MPARTLSEPEFNAIKQRVLDALPSGLSEAEFNRVVGPALEQAIGEAENSPAPVEGSAAGRFLSNAAEQLNPIALAKGLVSAAAHPIDTLENIGAAAAEQARKAKDSYQQGDYWGAGGHAAAALLPVLGPAAANAGEQIASGDIAGGLGKSAGLVLPAATPAAVRGVSAALKAAPESAAAALEGGAAARVADVMAPKVGANKVRFGNAAEKVAPAIAKDIAAEGAPLTREGLHSMVGGKLQEAEQALDAAADARLSARTFPTKPIVDALLEKRRALTSEAVEASQYPPKVSNLTAKGEETVLSQKQATPIGKDVVPAPNKARVAAIDQAIKEIQALGPVARYEPLRRIRQAWDGPASVKYSPSVTADFLKNQGYANGAADVTGTLREALAKFDPETAKANADYALYRKANDVLEATAEVERTRPRVGRQIIARMTGTILGEQAGGVAGAAAGYFLGPVLDSASGAGATTKLQTAALMTKLAGAIRKGDLGYVNSLSVQLKRLGRNALRTEGNATSPSESQSQTTVPALSTP